MDTCTVCVWVYIADFPHLLVVVLPRYEVVHQSDPVAQLLAQSIQELVGVPAARRAREGEEFLTAGQRVGAGVRVLRGVGGAFQADVRVGVHAALVVDLIYRSGEGFLPGQGQAGLPVACKDRWLLSTWCQCRCVTADWLAHFATTSFKKYYVTSFLLSLPYGWFPLRGIHGNTMINCRITGT